MGLTAMPPTDPKFRPPIRLRSLSKLLLLTLAAATLAWFGWTRGRYQSVSFRVTGPSMAPTLRGEHHVGNCQNCGRHGIAIDASTEQTLPANIPCFLCGTPLTVNPDEIHLGDTAIVQPLASGESISIGELVAIQTSDGLPLRVKRVVAISGQTIDHDADRLTVDGRRIEDTLFEVDQASLPRLIIADESKSGANRSSRWSPSDAGDSAWRHDHGTWHLERAVTTSLGEFSTSDWLVYHHQNVHQHNAAGPVLDDYEYNAALMQRLHEVDRLQVTAEIFPKAALGIEVAYWLPDGAMVDRIDAMPPGLDSRSEAGQVTESNTRALVWSTTQSALDLRHKNASDSASAPVTRENPIAIRFFALPTAGTDNEFRPRLEKLRVWKSVTYRLRRNDDRTKYPLKLRPNEYFVLGDNVPVSIDSRNHGPVQRDQVAGVIRPATSPLKF